MTLFFKRDLFIITNSCAVETVVVKSLHGTVCGRDHRHGLLL